jgi:maltose-binding protein MalE
VPAASTATPARPTSAPKPSNAPPTALPDRLTLWVAADERHAEALRLLLADIARQAGADIDVMIKDAAGMVLDARVAVLTNEPLPDLYWGTQDDLAALNREGLLQPAIGQFAEDDLLPAAVAGATVDGQRWGTPIAAQGFLLLLYNRRLADAAPATSDELIARTRALSGADRYGIVAGWAEPRWLAAWYSGAGGTLTDNAGQPALDTPAMVAALNLLKELRVAGPPQPSTYAAGARLFGEGQAAFAIDGDWAIDGYRQYSSTLDLAFAPMPRVSATGRIAAPPLTGLYLMYSKEMREEQRRQALGLAEALIRPDTQARIARELTVLPARRSLLTDPVVTQDPVLAAAAAQTDGAIGLPATPGLRCAWQAIGTALPAVLTGETTPEAAAAQMQANAVNCWRTQ